MRSYTRSFCRHPKDTILTRRATLVRALLEFTKGVRLRRFYSQLGQDKWVIRRIFPGVHDGYFLDIGAAHAKRVSNSKALENIGWDGICIEPFPTGPWHKRRAQLFKEVVYSKAGETIEFRAAGFVGGVDKHIDTWRHRTDQAPVIEARTTTIGEILRRARAPEYIHYMSLDVEGAEWEIIRVFPFDRYRLGAMTIEHNAEEPKRTRIRRLLAEHGYRLVKEDNVEDWYVFGRSE